MIAKRLCAPLFAAAAMMTLSGCLSMKAYVDPTLGDVKPADRAAPVVDKKPVQLVFDFHTNGASNAKVTQLLAKQVTDQVSASGMFSQVSTTPAAGGAILSITVNNVPEKDAAGKGFATGLTLGLAGTMATDYYIGSAKYVSSPGAPVIVGQEKHAIHTQIGAGSPPANLIPVKDLEEGARTMMRQMVDHLLNDVAKDPGFAGKKVAAITYSGGYMQAAR